MNTSRDGCIEFDTALMDAASGDPLGHDAQSHVARCARCTRALADYRNTVGALMHEATARPAVGRARPLSLRTYWLHAAAALVVAALGVRLALAPQPPVVVEVAAIDARPHDGAQLTRLDADTARLDAGVCTFLMGAAMGVVQTPLGAFSCTDCSFTITVGPVAELHADDTCGDDTHVQISVLRGLVATSMLDRPRMLVAGETMTISGP